MWAAQYYHCLRPRQFITSGGLGTMGYGFPAAIGAQLAFPNAVVIDIAGDGSFQMNVQELATVVQYNLPVIVAILNNHSLGMVRQWQQFFYDERYADTSLEVSPDYVKLADAYGAVGLAGNPTRGSPSGPGTGDASAPSRGDRFCRQNDGKRLSDDSVRRLDQRYVTGIGVPMMPTNHAAVHRHIFAVLVENHFGVLGRITGLFSARGFNIESLCVAETEDPTVSRITLVTTGDDKVLEQVHKQLHRLIDVIKVTDLSEEPHVDREMVLVKVHAEAEIRAEVLRLAEIFRAKIVDVTPKTYVLEITGDEGKIEAVLDLLKPLGIKEMVRTGKIAIARGQRML